MPESSGFTFSGLRLHSLGAVFGATSVVALSLSACGGSPSETAAPQSDSSASPDPNGPASPEESSPADFYEPTLHDYAFADESVWDDETGDYISAGDVDDEALTQLEELLLLIDSYDQSAWSSDHVNAEYMQAFRPHLTDRLFAQGLEIVETREEEGLAQNGAVAIEKMLVTYYQPGSEVSVSACRDFSENNIASTASPGPSDASSFDEDVREARAIRADGRWIIQGQYSSEYTCDQIRDA